MESKEEAMMMVAAPAAGAGEAKNGPPVAVDKAGAAPADRADAAVLAKVEMDRKLSMIKAWEESEKSKAQNKAEKKMLSAIMAWEKTKKAAVEAKLRTRERRSWRRRRRSTQRR
ncbi:remorin isoform X9 [Sorghum bicolor]|uniref:remorin isoform X9 n=1 Tax=Sorghum bicolor TaxID=4558 RepID=UPI000B426929|nr:remorin isoform X9 [Sorghum bicolor]|eukprot:XP_021314383.1 remorin isoform X9 [Sorghum bicolor]